MDSHAYLKSNPRFLVPSIENFAYSHPPAVLVNLIAALARWSVPFVCTETRELGEEVVASSLLAKWESRREAALGRFGRK